LITILQVTVVTQTVLGGLAIYPPVANFLGLQLCTQNYDNWL